MKINLKGCAKWLAHDMKKSRVKKSIISEFEFLIIDNLIPLMEELRERKSEGEIVIDEFLSVFCMKDKE